MGEERLKVGHYAVNERLGERRLVIGYISRVEEVTFSWSTKWESAREWAYDGPAVFRAPYSRRYEDYANVASGAGSSGDGAGDGSNSNRSSSD